MAALCVAFMLTGALSPVSAQAAEPVPAATPQEAASRWEAMRRYAASLPSTHRIGMVNIMFNNFQYTSDRELHGVDDLWDAPLELVARGAGDCEDFAIAKYFMLLQAGLDARDLKLGYAMLPAGPGKASALAAPDTSGRAHVVVLYHGAGHRADPLVLDVISEVAPLSARTDLHLMFDFDHQASYAVYDAGAPIVAVQQMVSRLLPVLQRSGWVDGADMLRVAARRPAGDGIVVSGIGSMALGTQTR